MMSSLYERTTNREGHENLFIAGLIELPKTGQTVEIYGEEHSSKSNKFYEEVIEEDLLKDYVVMCEHSTLLCDIQPDEYKLFEGIATGGEYILFNLTKKRAEGNKDLPKPICVDNRIESGLPTAIEEGLLRNFFSELLEKENLTENDLLEFSQAILRLTEIYTSVKKIKAVFNKVSYYKDKIEDFYTILEQQFSQLKIFLKDMDIDTACNFAILIVSNLKRICSAYVDLNILIQIGKIPDNKRIAVFTGAAHAYRLLTMFEKFKPTILVNPSEEILRLLEFKPVTE